MPRLISEPTRIPVPGGKVIEGRSVVTSAGERIRYSCGPQGAEYVAVCLPAFSPETVGREDRTAGGEDRTAGGEG